MKPVKTAGTHTRLVPKMRQAARSLPELSASEFIRYSRSIMHFGEQTQQHLKAQKVLIVGLGGLGAPLALSLAAAGVGELILFDDDHVELSNLARQTLYNPDDCGLFKCDVLAALLRKQNPHVHIKAFATRPSAELLAQLGADCALLLDCTDNFDSRLLLNQQSRVLKLPLFSASVSANQAQLYLLDQTGPCYQCLVGDSTGSTPGNCQSLGVDPVLVQLVAQQLAYVALSYLRQTAVASPAPESTNEAAAMVSTELTPALAPLTPAALPLNQLGLWHGHGFSFVPLLQRPSCRCCQAHRPATPTEIPATTPISASISSCKESI